MDFARKQRWIGAVSLGLAVLAVLVWWVAIVPRTARFKDHKRKTGIEAKLHNIELPRGAYVVHIGATNVPKANRLAVVGTYAGLLECGTVVAHYKEQFPKQGFVLTNETEELQEHSEGLSFSAPDYDVRLTCNGQGLSSQYVIVMWTKS